MHVGMMMVFASYGWENCPDARVWDEEMRLPNIERGRAMHRKYHGTEPPQVMLTEFCICGTTLAEAEEEAHRYQGKFVESNFSHYEFFSEHFKTVKGYDACQQKPAEGGDRTPGRARGGPEDRRRFRAQRSLPLWRHTLRSGRAGPEALCQGGAAGAAGAIAGCGSPSSQ